MARQGAKIHSDCADSTLPFKAPVLVVSCGYDMAAGRAASFEGTFIGELEMYRGEVRHKTWCVPAGRDAEPARGELGHAADDARGETASRSSSEN